MTSSTRHPANTDPGGSAGLPLPHGRSGPGRAAPSRAGVRGAGAPGPAAAGGGRGVVRPPARLSTNSQRRRADPHRVAEPEHLAAAHALAVDERPVGRAEILDRQPPVRVADDAGVAAGELTVVAELPVAAHRAPDDELLPQREPAARRAAGGDDELRDLGQRGWRCERSGTAPELAGHLQDRLAHPHDVAAASVRGASMRSSLTNVPFADPRSSIVSRPVGAARDACVAARDLGIAAEPPSSPELAADQQVGVHAQERAAFLALGHPQLLASHQPPPLPLDAAGVPGP